tara:strand:- start:2022 stop:2135 length:114 start_codon:yes stop_codon:yes gene_type:complete
MLTGAGRPEDAVIMVEALPFGPSKKSSDEKKEEAVYA